MRPATRPPGAAADPAAAGSCAQRLAALLAPYADPDPTQAGRLFDVPPAVAAAALALLPKELASARINLSGPSSAALVAVADEFGGRLVGSLAPGDASSSSTGSRSRSRWTGPPHPAGRWPSGSPSPGRRPPRRRRARIRGRRGLAVVDGH